MRKQRNSGKTRQELEDEGQMTIFDMIESGVDPEEVVAKADEELNKNKESSKKLKDNPIGLRSDGTNMDIDDVIPKDESEVEPSHYLDDELMDELSDFISPSEMNAMLNSDENENVDKKQEVQQISPEIASIIEDHVSESELSAILNAGFEAEDDIKVEKDNIEYDYYTLDNFAGSAPGYYDRLVAFDTSLPTSDKRFVITADRDDYESISDFKQDFAGQGGLNEHLIIAFPLQADKDPEVVIAMYEKKIASTHKADVKNADKEAKQIAALEASGIEFDDDYSDDSTEQEKPKKRGRPKVKR
jgi:hypothetical protein